MYVLCYVGGFAVFYMTVCAALASDGVIDLSAGMSGRRWIPLELTSVYVFGMLVAARVLYAILHDRSFENLQGVWGGYAVFLVALVPYLRVRRLPRASVLSAVAVGLGVAMAVAKLGCLSAGCCYGRPTDAGWGAASLGKHDTPAGTLLYPTQWLDAGVFLLAAGVAAISRRTGGRSGRALLWFLVVAGTGRALTETLRGDTRPMFRGHVSVAQAAAGFAALVALLVLAVPPLRRAWDRWTRPGETAAFRALVSSAAARLRTGSPEPATATSDSSNTLVWPRLLARSVAVFVCVLLCPLAAPALIGAAFLVLRKARSGARDFEARTVISGWLSLAALACVGFAVDYWFPATDLNELPFFARGPVSALQNRWGTAGFEGMSHLLSLMTVLLGLLSGYVALRTRPRLPAEYAALRAECLV